MLFLLVTSCLFIGSLAFPNGAPQIACGPMIPGHLPSTTSGTNPFMLNISSTTYTPGQEINGVLYSADNLDFRGFLIRVGTPNEIPSEELGVGTFVNVDSSIQQLACGFSSVTHINNSDKKEVKFTWKGPATPSGDLYVRATVVQKFFPSRYFLGSFSQRISPA